MRQLVLVAGLALGTAGGALACPDYTLGARALYEGTGAQLRRPQAFGVVAGGESYIWDCPAIDPQSDRGAGYFPSQPDFRFDLRGMGGLRLSISVVSECDAALLINTGTATWYYDDDDNGNLDPRIVLTRPADGPIDIWIGTYDGAYCDAELRLETSPR